MAKAKVKYRYRSRPKKRYRRRKTKIPLAPVLGLAATLLHTKHPWAADGDNQLNKLMTGNFQQFINDAPSCYLGLMPDGIHWEQVWQAWSPTLLGIGIHMTVGKFANKYLRKVPYVNI